MAIKFADGMKLQLWVWDSGDIEGFSIFLNGEFLDERTTLALKYDIDAPTGDEAIVVHFAGVDGGATKIVDAAKANAVLESQESGLKHSYVITK